VGTGDGGFLWRFSRSNLYRGDGLKKGNRKRGLGEKKTRLPRGGGAPCSNGGEPSSENEEAGRVLSSKGNLNELLTLVPPLKGGF